jgi:Cu-Zn family superoxide dismutase
MKLKTWFMIIMALCYTGNVYAKTAVAELKPTAADSRLKGKVKFADEKGGVVVLAEVWNAPPGKHGLHIHENGSCADLGKAAGGHYNPNGNPHGYAPKDFPLHAHPGDMGNIDVDVDGHGTVKLHMPELGLANSARYDIVGRAVILHEKVDDFSQPTGNAGGRIACGVIEEK